MPGDRSQKDSKHSWMIVSPGAQIKFLNVNAYVTKTSVKKIVHVLLDGDPERDEVRWHERQPCGL